MSAYLPLRQQLVGVTIVQIEPPALGRHAEVLPVVNGKKGRWSGSIPVVHVMRRLLRIPNQPAGIDVERNNRIGEQIASGPGIAGIIGRRITNRYIQRSCRRVQGVTGPR
jgi:hypothetical protein